MASKQTPSQAFASAYSDADALLEIIRERLGASVKGGDCRNATWAEAHYAQHVRERLTAIAAAFAYKSGASEQVADEALEAEIARVREVRS